MNTMLGFWPVGAVFVFWACSGDKDNQRTAPVGARASAILPIQFAIVFSKARLIPRMQVESKNQAPKKAAWTDPQLTLGRAVLIYFYACRNSITLPNNPGRPCRPRMLSERCLSLEREQLSVLLLLSVVWRQFVRRLVSGPQCWFGVVACHLALCPQRPRLQLPFRHLRQLPQLQR